METLKFGYKHFKKCIPLSIFSEILSFAGIYAELLLPILTGMLVDFVIQKGTVTEESGGMFHFLLTGKYGEVHSMKLFFSIAAVFMILLVIRIMFIYFRDLIQEWTGLQLEGELRDATYAKLMELDSATISKYNSGELLQILNTDTVMFKYLFAIRIPNFGDIIFMTIVTLILIGQINFSFIIIPLLLMPILILAVNEFRKRANKIFNDIRNRSSEMNLNVQENIAGVRIVRSFTNEETEKEKFEVANTNFLKARLVQINTSANFNVLFGSINQIAYISTLVIGAILVINGKMSVGYILTVSAYVMRIMSCITTINDMIYNIQQQMVAGRELKRFVERDSEVTDNKENSLHTDTPHIELKDVCLNIEGQDVLKNINLSIPYGKKVGIVGETGSGKSVLLKTLIRIRDISSGSITISGHDIKEYSLKNLRNMFSYVFQDVFLFSNTIEANIAFNQMDVVEEKVTDAAGHAQASSFIESMIQQYKTVIGERGLGISGGQKQRLSIARAFHKNAPIFVLDDSTSALDVNTERTLLQDLHDNFSSKTLIITAHRFSSVVDCDEIIYLKDGEITERGTFEELMALNGSFAHVYNVQQAQKAGSIADKIDKQNGGGVNG